MSPSDGCQRHQGAPAYATARRPESSIVPEKRGFDGTGRGCGRRWRPACRGPVRGGHRHTRAGREREVRLRHPLQPVRHQLGEVRPADSDLRPQQRRGRHGDRRYRLQGGAVHHQGAAGPPAARKLGLSRPAGVVHREHRRLEQAPLRRHHRAVADGDHDGRAPGADCHPEDVLAQGHQGPAADAHLQRLLRRPHGQPDAGRGSAAQAGQRHLPDGLRGVREADQRRHELVHPVQPAEPHRQLLERRRTCCASARSA